MFSSMSYEGVVRGICAVDHPNTCSVRLGSFTSAVKTTAQLQTVESKWTVGAVFRIASASEGLEPEEAETRSGEQKSNTRALWQLELRDILAGRLEVGVWE